MANKKLKLLYLARYLREETDERHPRTCLLYTSDAADEL